MSGLAGKTVVLGVTGGIAAYKAAELCRLLIKAGAKVRVVMTGAATRFIPPLTMQTLSGAPVGLDLLDAGEEARIGHIRLGDEADLILIAPATANTIARLAAGLADDLLSAVVLASRVPVLLAPAMVGEGRLIEPAEIVAAAENLLATQDLTGRRVVVTAGPTFEPIDDVRFVGNRSSGKMGFAIAQAAARRGAAVTLIAGPVAVPTPLGGGIARVDVATTLEMRAALAAAVVKADVVVMAAAVADFRPAARVAGKLSRRRVAAVAAGTPPNAAPLPASAGSASSPVLALVANPDLLAELAGSRRGSRPFLVGFAAEMAGAAGTGTLAPDELIARARSKLAEKRCDVIVANDVGAAGIGFGGDENAVTLVFADGRAQALPRATKLEIAHRFWDHLRDVLPRSASARAAREADRQRPRSIQQGAPDAHRRVSAVGPARPRARGGVRGRRA
ncbi:MAG: bifunctional phosphopantothenoylcysteine decarboxylase/phosphopantothenate synthase [Bacteroidota bacterium]